MLPPKINFSKWVKHQVLLGEEEMKDLFTLLSPFFLYNVSEIVANPKLSPEDFLGRYQNYVGALKRGEVIDERRAFSPVISSSAEALYLHEVKPGAILARPILPVIQLQLHHFLPSGVDGKFYPMVLSEESISWGLQFSYPQIFQNPQDQTYVKIDGAFSNTSLFSKLVKWLRSSSVPTTFLWRGSKISTPIRLGKSCFSWIHRHPQLFAKEIGVHVY